MASFSSGVDDAARQIQGMVADFIRYANGGDAKSLTDAFYADDAQLLPPNAAPINGKASIMQFWKAFLAEGATDIGLETVQVSSSGDLAYEVGKYKAAIAGNRQEGKYVVIYRRQQNGRYQAIVDMFSPNA
jgi:ketosteroid isomerase-like protein